MNANTRTALFALTALLSGWGAVAQAQDNNSIRAGVYLIHYERRPTTSQAPTFRRA